MICTQILYGTYVTFTMQTLPTSNTKMAVNEFRVYSWVPTTPTQVILSGSSVCLKTGVATTTSMILQANFDPTAKALRFKYDDYTYTDGVATATGGLFNFRSTVVSNGWSTYI